MIFSHILHYYCNGANKTRDGRIHMQSFIPRHGLKTGKVNEQQTGMAEA